jgi:Ras-related protein Rab-11A
MLTEIYRIISKRTLAGNDESDENSGAFKGTRILVPSQEHNSEKKGCCM